MKSKLFLLIILSLSVCLAIAQETTNPVNTVSEEEIENPEEEIEKSSISHNGVDASFIFNWKTRSSRRVNYMGAYLGFAGISNSAGLDINPWRSYHAEVGLLSISIPISWNWKFGIGMGFGINTYRIRDHKTLQLIDGKTEIVKPDEQLEYKNSNFYTGYASLSYIIEYQYRIKKNLFRANLSLDLLMNSVATRSEVKIKNASNKYDRIEYAPLSIEPASYRTTLRVGFNEFSLYANCALSSLFQKSKGPHLYPWAVGIALTY